MSAPTFPIDEMLRICRLTDLLPHHRQALTERLRYLRLKTGKFLSFEGKTAPNRLAFIVSGRVRILKKNRFDDSRILLGVLGPGAIIGDPWEDVHEANVASAQTMEDLELFLLEAGDFEELIEQHPELGIRLLKRLHQDFMRRRRHVLERLAGFY